MKRHIYKYKDIRKIWPLFFWMPCKKCKAEFRRELGWTYNGNARARYMNGGSVCGQCCPTAREAQEEILRKPPRPNPPKGSSATNRFGNSSIVR